MNRKTNTAKLTYAALLTALAIILSYFPEIPLAFFAPWLKLDFSFTPLLLLGFAIGPGMAAIAIVVTNVVHIIGGTTGGVGELANILIGLAFVMPPAFLYRKSRTWRSAIVGMVIGILLMMGASIVANRYLLLPKFLGDNFEEALNNFGMNLSSYLWGAILPFNFIKGLLNAFLTRLLYKRLSNTIKEAEKDVAVSD
ncbi:MAG: ECF transporter S component [Christensenellales bacterium]|jgi:riboflavin transporter FmnP